MNTQDIANVILDIVDCGKRYIPTDEFSDDDAGTVAELRMQLREVAFALISGKDIDPSKLH